MKLNILAEMNQILIITNCDQNQGSLLKSLRKFVHQLRVDCGYIKITNQKLQGHLQTRFGFF